MAEIEMISNGGELRIHRDGPNSDKSSYSGTFTLGGLQDALLEAESLGIDTTATISFFNPEHRLAPQYMYFETDGDHRTVDHRAPKQTVTQYPITMGKLLVLLWGAMMIGFFLAALLIL